MNKEGPGALSLSVSTDYDTFSFPDELARRRPVLRPETHEAIDRQSVLWGVVSLRTQPHGHRLRGRTSKSFQDVFLTELVIQTRH